MTLLFLALFAPQPGFAQIESGPQSKPTPAEHGATPEEKPPTEKPTLSNEALLAAKNGARAFQAGEFKKAAAEFQRMLELAPGHPMAEVNLATAKYRLGQLPEAEALLRSALRKDPDTTQVWITLGIICLDQKKPDSALAALARAVELDPEDARGHNYLGVTLADRGWLIGAESELRRAVELNPAYAEANFNLALVYLRRTPPAIELARRHYQQAIDLGASPDPAVEKQLSQQP